MLAHAERASRWCATMLAAVVLVGPARTGGEEDVARILEGIGAAAGVEEATRQLVGLGPEALAPLLVALESGTLPARSKPLDDGQAQAVLAALGGFPRDELFGFLRSALPQEAALERRELVLRLISAYGRAQEVDLAFTAASLTRAATPEERRIEGRLPSPPLAPALERALTTLLERDDAALGETRARWPGLGQELLLSVFRAVGTSGDPRGLVLLGDALGVRPLLDGNLLSQIARLAPLASDDQCRAAAARVRAFLGDPREGVRASAAVALGRLGDCECVAALIGLLGGPEEGVRSNAHWALRQVTGLSLPASEPLWLEWHRRELAWFESSAEDAFAALESEDPGLVHAAMQAIVERRLWRDRLADEVLVVLEHPEARLRAAGCDALAKLGSKSALSGLIDLFDDEEPDVVQHAWQALRALTGKDLPSHAAAWRGELAPR
jgi:HEAT repeat protein